MSGITIYCHQTNKQFVHSDILKENNKRLYINFVKRAMAKEIPVDQVTLDLENIKESSKDEDVSLGNVFTERVSALMKHRDVDTVLSDQQHM